MSSLSSDSPMDLNTRKELFSYAHIHAVASVAGFSVQLKSRPMDSAGLDLLVEVPGSLETGTVAYPKFEAQVKCTAVQSTIKEDTINFPLEVKNYNQLRISNPMIPLILIVVLVPENLNDWAEVRDTETIIRKCAYWLSLKGCDTTANTDKITVRIPRDQIFSPDALSQIMTKIANRQEL